MMFDKSQQMILASSFVSPSIAAMFTDKAGWNYCFEELGNTATIPRMMHSWHIKEKSSRVPPID